MVFQNNNISFKVNDILNHLNELKSSNTEYWWKNFIEIDWSNVRSSINTKWISIKYRPNINVQASRLNVVILNEKHVGQIIPLIPEDNTADKTKVPDRDTRTTKVSIQIQKWSRPVKTMEDRITPYMENGKPVYPEDKYLSKYYQFIELLQEIFMTEVEERTDRSNKLMNIIRESKNKVTALDTIEGVTNIRQTIGHVCDGDTIIIDNDYKNVKEKFKTCYAELLKGFIQVSNSKIFPLVQEYVSDKALKNKGCKLSNPMTRITIPFDLKTYESTALILDKSKEIKIDGKKTFEPAKVDNQPVNAQNIHKVIEPGSIIDGIICMDAICFSQLGTSIPIKLSTGIIMHPSKKAYSVTDVCDSIYGNETTTSTNEVERKISEDSDDSEDTEVEKNSSDNLLDAMV
jgi:hypothetical protein